MVAAEGAPAVLHAGGEDQPCETVFVGTGGHRVAPGFQLRGYIAGTKAEPSVQMIYIECAGGCTGSRIDASPSTTATSRANTTTTSRTRAGWTPSLEVDLDQVAGELAYPVGDPVEG